MERALILSGGGARGAFQVGVLKYLEEIGWKPDLVCGTSVGAINAVAIGCGIHHQQLKDIWVTCDNQRMYQWTIRKFLTALLNQNRFHPIMDTYPMRSLITQYVNIDLLRKSDIEIIISAVNLKTSLLSYFNHRVITIDHIMASAAMPIFFPWQEINGEPYWDGGVMTNIPIIPALERGAQTIIVVLLSPIGNFTQTVPKNFSEALELLLEHFLMGPYQSIMASPAWMNHLTYDHYTEYSPLHRSVSPEKRKILTVSPSKKLGLRSLLFFSPKQSHQLIEAGYIEAKRQLKDLV